MLRRAAENKMPKYKPAARARDHWLALQAGMVSYAACLISALAICCISPCISPAVWAFQDQEKEAGVAYFEKYIRPLFSQHCYECHSAKSKEREGNLSLDSRLGWTEGGET